MLSDDLHEFISLILSSAEQHKYYSSEYKTEIIEGLANLYKVVFELDMNAQDLEFCRTYAQTAFNMAVDSDTEFEDFAIMFTDNQHEGHHADHNEHTAQD